MYYKIVHVFTCTVFSMAFLISAADIPYFNYFFAHLNATVFSYFSSFGFLVKMIVQEPAYLIFAFLFAVVCVLYVLLMNRYYKKVLSQKRKDIRYFKTVPFALLCILLCCVGMRGRLAAKSPLRVGTAYHCNNAFLNYVGLNPSFTLLKSVEEYNKTANKALQLVDSKTANELWEQQKNSRRENNRAFMLKKGTNGARMVEKVLHRHPGLILTEQSLSLSTLTIPLMRLKQTMHLFRNPAPEKLLPLHSQVQHLTR